MSNFAKIRVLVVDDSLMVQKIISRALARDSMIEVVGTASDAYEARDKILELSPSVVTLDIEMPRLDGISFLKVLMKHHPLPVVVVSSLTQAGSSKAYEAIEAGAVEVLSKPSTSSLLADFEVELVQKVKSAFAARFPATNSIVTRRSTEAGQIKYLRDRVLVLGASTGGIEAIKEVLSQFPEGMPPICIVQHIPAYISTRFASRLNDLCAMEVREAVNGDVLSDNLALLAPGGFHMVLHRSKSGGYQVELTETERVNYQRPAVDVLFSSAAVSAGPRAIGVLLTGMGKDGAEGMLQLKNAGAVTIAQNEATSVVYGMPRAAVELGAVRHVLPLERIAPAVMRSLTVKKEEG